MIDQHGKLHEAIPLPAHLWGKGDSHLSSYSYLHLKKLLVSHLNQRLSDALTSSMSPLLGCKADLLCTVSFQLPGARA